MKAILFYIFSVLILACGIFTVTSRKIYRAAIFLLLTVVSVAALYFLMEYTFLGVVQLVIYAGGIVVLILFAVLLTHDSGSLLPPLGVKRTVATFALTGTGLTVFLYTILGRKVEPGSGEFNEPSVKMIGGQLLDLYNFGFVLPFEAISILLLAAMVGCIVLAMKFSKTMN
ncbi:MAG: NADH-quinone oxidoreductase subunit J [Bacteroidetes bacterium]|nr:NADH-quinone oxidoreductase subunit J [Bacteroidota bacterium]